MIENIVPAGVREAALGEYLRRAYPAIPGWALRDALKKRDVRVNGEKSGADARVRSGDVLAIYLPDKFFAADVAALYEDERFLLVEKPAGLPVDADADGVGADTLISRVRAKWPGAELCHRLDAYTGGVVMCAKTAPALDEALAAFRERRVEKRYLCVTGGAPEEGLLVDYFIKDSRAALVIPCAPNARGALRAETAVRPIARKGEVCLVEARPLTGRTHQIRAQLARAGHPLVGDDKYGDRALNARLGVKRPALWCAYLEYGGVSAESRPRLPFFE